MIGDETMARKNRQAMVTPSFVDVVARADAVHEGRMPDRKRESPVLRTACSRISQVVHRMLAGLL